MKYTLNIDSALLDRVVQITGAATKTEAIHLALREVDRKARLLEVLREGTGVEGGMEDLFDPALDPLALRVAERPSAYGVNREERA